MRVYTELEIIESLKSRIGYGYKQSDLAEQLEVSNCYLSGMLKGKRRIKDKILASLGYEKVIVKVSK